MIKLNKTTESYWGNELVSRSVAFAAEAHASQTRKYTNEPYITHPISVARMVAEEAGTPEMIAAALLHDIVEDTPVTAEQIEMEFGGVVAELVRQLTDVSRPEDGNRAHRKALDRDHLSKGSAAAKTIKLADLIDNAGSIQKHDPKFAKVYMAEKKLLLEVLADGDARLLAQAKAIVAGHDMGVAQG